VTNKNLHVTDSALKAIAKQEGVTAEQVKRDIRTAMLIGLSNQDQQIVEYWKSIPCEGEFPTPVEVVVFLADEVMKNQ